MSSLQDDFFLEKRKKGSITVETIPLTVKKLRDLYENNHLNLEDYQREYAYNAKKFEKASKVLETVMFGKVLPAIVVRTNLKDDYEIIDGQQRVMSLLKFVANEFALNFKNSDDAFMLKGFMFKDLNHELKSLILNYEITAMKVHTEFPEIVTEIFLDLNYQPIAVTSNEMTTSISYGNIVKKAKELSKVGSGKFVDNPEIWKLFGHQTRYKKDGSFNVPAKDKGGSISLAVFKTMLSFIDKKIVLDKDRNWISKQVIESKDNNLSDYGLDKFEHISNYIYTMFVDEILSNDKNLSPFFNIPTGKTIAVFVSELSEIFYLSLSEIYIDYILNISDYSVDDHSKIDKEIKTLFIDEIKPKVIFQLEDESELNQIKEQFIQKINALL